MSVKNFLRVALIVGALPNTLTNGTTADATQVMADLNWIVNQVNANAAPLANTAVTNANNNFTAVQSGTAATAQAHFPIAQQVQNMVFNTLSSTLGTNTLTARVAALPLTANAAGQIFAFQPAQKNTGAVVVTIDTAPQLSIKKNSAGGPVNLTSSDLISANTYLVLNDGTEQILLNPRPYAQGPAIPSSSSMNLNPVSGDYFHITGTSQINVITLEPGEMRTVIFDSSPLITNSATLIVQGATSYTPVAGDMALIRGEPSATTRVFIMTAAGTPVVNPAVVNSFNARTGAVTDHVLSSAVAPASGASVDFTGIPSWAKRITCLMGSVSTNGTSQIIIQIGSLSGGIEITGYNGWVGEIASASAGSSNLSAGFAIRTTTAASVHHGAYVLTNVTGNLWACSGSIGRSDTTNGTVIGGSKSLTSTLDRIRFTAANGTDVFDMGTLNILYEG